MKILKILKFAFFHLFTLFFVSSNTNSIKETDNSPVFSPISQVESAATIEKEEKEQQATREEGPVVHENPFSRKNNKKITKETADAKARALFQSCQEAANRTVIESMGNVDQYHSNKTNNNSTRPQFADSSKTKKTGNFELQNDFLKTHKNSYFFHLGFLKIIFLSSDVLKANELGRGS